MPVLSSCPVAPLCGPSLCDFRPVAPLPSFQTPLGSLALHSEFLGEAQLQAFLSYYFPILYIIKVFFSFLFAFFFSGD